MWKGATITTAGFNAIFSEFGVSEPVKHELGYWTCKVGDRVINVTTLTELSRLVIQALIDNAKTST